MGRRIPLVVLLAFAVGACGERQGPAPRERSRRIVRLAPLTDSLPPACGALPDTINEIARATVDDHDFPDARIPLDSTCRGATIVFRGGARVTRTYHVNVPDGMTLVARARGESAGVAMAFDVPPMPDSANARRPRTVTDSVTLAQGREVAIRVMLAPKLKDEPNESRVLLSVVVRP